ncbi:MAG: alkaline phosphatase [Bacteroidales bacterium]|nr:alkaline phosphatase [Bacteroidales bacterium]
MIPGNKVIRSFKPLFFFLCLCLLSLIPSHLLAGLPVLKNIIILIGDGMGYNHIQCLNYYQGIKAQPFEQFPVKLAMSTYPVKAGHFSEGNPSSNHFTTGYNTVAAWSDTSYLKKNFTESAAAATAIATGFKTYNNAIGMSINQDTLSNITEWAKGMGKSAGIVTTVPVSHATPAGFVAHNKLRTDYSRIAYQMFFNSRCDVIMGCGNPMYDGDGQAVKGSWKNAKYVGDSALWQQMMKGSGKQIQFTIKGKNLQLNDCNGDGKPDPWTVITKKEDFRKLGYGKTPERVLGCAEIYSTLQQERSRANGETNNSSPNMSPMISTVPTLAEMVSGALNVLDNNPRGFFLMVEGGAIDWAAHGNQKGRLIEELAGFSDAVNTVISWVETHSSWDETLVIVTGDHETGLLWGDGPFVPVTDHGKGNLPGMQFYSTDHTNSLIPFYAKGAGCEHYRNFADEYDSLRGPYIQNSEIAQLIRLLLEK